MDPVESIVTFTHYESIDRKRAAIIAYFQVMPATVPDYIIFRKVAADLREDCNFYWETGEPTVIQLRDGLNHKITFKATPNQPSDNYLIYPCLSISYDQLRTWATDKCIPLVGEINSKNEELTVERLPLLILFHERDDKNSLEAYTQVIHE